jgi:hypothetical protein
VRAQKPRSAAASSGRLTCKTRDYGSIGARSLKTGYSSEDRSLATTFLQSPDFRNVGRRSRLDGDATLPQQLVQRGRSSERVTKEKAAEQVAE